MSVSHRARTQDLRRKWEVLIYKDGHVSQSIDAVLQWVYKPTLLNGAPVSVLTTVEVNFTVS